MKQLPLSLLRGIGQSAYAFASAALITLASPPIYFAPLMWIAIAPWLYRLNRVNSKREALVQGIWMSWWFTIGIYSWIVYSLHQFAYLPWWLCVVALCVYGLLSEPQFIAYAIVRFLIKKHTSTNAPALVVVTILALTYTGLDWILPKQWMDTFGQGFVRSPILRQAADIGGAHLLTFAIMLNAEGLVHLFEKLKGKNFRPKDLIAWIPAGAAIAGIIAYGLIRLPQIESAIHEANKNPIKVTAIQANIGDFEKLASESGVGQAAYNVVNKYIQLSLQALEDNGPEVIVWPETAYPSTFRTPTSAREFDLDQMVERFVDATKTTLLFGGYDNKFGKDYNSFFFLEPFREKPRGTGESSTALALQTYHKSILLLFAEYIPGAESFQFLKDLFPQVGNFGIGPGPTSYTVRSAKGREFSFIPTICYEILYPQFVIDGVNKGANLILNVTNDSWFGPWGEPDLHLALSIFRSIETRTPQLRATNTGYTALILPDGSTPRITTLGEIDLYHSEVPVLKPVWTLMKAWGDWFGKACCLMSLLGIAFLLLRFKRVA